ncbi:Malonyl-[acyl-carrier protein] O-methyltransferase [Folsomia candida]|uniref:Malonyl-[acyl-carrier protein] O-methyltransferase n=1 Tax=Folsomia candida TaxID=158441 RepID=A0A226DY51_FOLCA|nr:Malonyl-[acyl-carrier protein] O-methyltransferase [Folsomia candida]
MCRRLVCRPSIRNPMGQVILSNSYMADGKALCSLKRGNLIQTILSDYPARKFPIILDIGCGSGNLTRFLANSIPNEEIIAIDNDPDMVSFSVKNTTPGNFKIKFLCQDISIPWAQLDPELTRLAGQVDLIFSNYVLHWVIDIRTACQNLSRLLKQGGLFYFNIFGVKPLSIPNFGKYLKQESVEDQLAGIMATLKLNGLQVTRQNMYSYEWHYTEKDFEVLMPLMYAMHNVRIDSTSFTKLDALERDKIRQEIRIGCNEAYLFQVGNKGKIYPVGSGDPLLYCYDGFVIQGGKLVK